ncbi:MAG: 50S ribosomal protein L21 [Bdellovibrionota bacterium]|jgi:large subunit ribosomal protein L21
MEDGKKMENVDQIKETKKETTKEIKDEFKPYAVIATGGKQYKVSVGNIIDVETLNAEKGDEVILDNVLLVNDGTLKVGTPLVEGANVKAKVLSQFKGEKLLVFKKKRRQGYTNRQGHRQNLTKISIQSINA